MACCDGKSCEVEALREKQGAVLRLVLAINLVMFVVELAAGILAGSAALLADSLDMLGDSLAYGFSLYVVSRGARWEARAALFKGAIMAGFGLMVLGGVLYRLSTGTVPEAETMGVIGVLVLLANASCLALLWRHRGDNLNMHSVWLCSRNDILANIGVLLAAAGVWLLQSAWPDIVVGLLIAALFLRSAWQVLGRARQQLATT